MVMNVAAGYDLELAEALADQPDWVIETLASRTHGLTMRHPDFLPTIGQVGKMASDLLAKVGEEQERTKRIKQQFAEERAPNGQRYLSDPKLSWHDCPRLVAAFQDDYEIAAVLLEAKAPLLRAAVKAHAEKGKDAARTILDPRR